MGTSRKSLCMAYFFWLFGGFFGLHHFYLRRYKHAFLWFCLPGGYFGLGWLRDLWRIPEYVRDANDDPEYLRNLSNLMRKYERPPWKAARLVGQLVVGNLFAVLLMIAVPEKSEFGTDLSLIHKTLAPLACAIGIWIVGNVGRERGSLIYPVIGCYLGLPLYIFGFSNHAITTVLGIIAFQWKARQWRRQIREPASVWKGLFVLTLCGGIYMSLWGSYVYFNMRVVTKDGDEIKMREAVWNFLKSPAVQEFSQNVRKLWDHMLEHGFMSTMQQLIDSLDPLGEKNAIKVLGLKRNATQEEIKTKYRELTKLWHPDKFTDVTEKEQAHEKFLEIQNAYEKLSKLKKERSKKNKISMKDDNDE